MTRRIRLAAVAAALTLSAGLAVAEPAQAVPATVLAPSTLPAKKYVTPGSYCSSPGKIGHTKTGKRMKCKTTKKDHRYRWRAA